VTRRRTRLHEPHRPASRRSGILPGRRFALVLALVVGGLVGAGVAAADENQGQLVTATVYQAGKGATADSVSIGALEGNPQQCPTYSGPDEGFIGPGGDQALPAASWSLSSVLECLQDPVPISDVTGITVYREDGSPEEATASQLGPADLNLPSDFANPSQVPVISSDGDGIVYNRPARGVGDDNAADRVEDDLPLPFVIDVYEGPSLTVTATASQTTVPAGTTVSFTATATATGPGDSGLSYSWDFDGGGTPDSSTAQAPEVAFDTPGTYQVTLQATDAAGGGGGDSIQIAVTAASGQSPSNAKPHAPATGPQSSSGNTPGGPAGKARAEPPSTAGGKSHAGQHKHRQKSSPHATTSTTTASTTTTASGGGSPASGGGSPASGGGSPGSGRASGTTTSTATSRTSARARATARIKRRLSPSIVSGRLIGDVTPLPAGASPLVHVVPAPLATAPAARRPIRASALPALAAGLAVVLLFSLGAGRELRGRRGRRALIFGT